MLSMGTGTGMGMGTGAEELGSNPLHVPVACAAFKLTTSGQPLRVCVCVWAQCPLMQCKNAVRRKWTVDE